MVISEIHMGVMVSPAPRITPDRLWVTAMARYPTASTRIMLALSSTRAVVWVKMRIRFGPNSRISTVMTADKPTAISVPCRVPWCTRSSFCLLYTSRCV